MDYHNENDPNAAAWLRELIREGHIPPGHVDERSIVDVRPSDLIGYTRCHFFSGIGGWAYALRLAGVPDSYPCWTGSCPCQPFSKATHGRGKGVKDARHLFPSWLKLIRTVRPFVVFGEQVASAMSWLDEVGDGLENEGYTFWPVSLPAYCSGADHERERIYFAAHTDMHGKPECAFNAEVAVLPWLDCESFGVVQADGISERVAYRGFGNAIVPQIAAEFIRAAIEAINNTGK